MLVLVGRQAQEVHGGDIQNTCFSTSYRVVSVLHVGVSIADDGIRKGLLAHLKERYQTSLAAVLSALHHLMPNPTCALPISSLHLGPPRLIHEWEVRRIRPTNSIW